MISNSQCKNPLQSWNGKLMNYQVWKNGFDGRPAGHNIHFRSNFSHDRRRLTEKSGNGSSTASTSTNQARIILWGAHHKTGTFLAQKVFSVVCARMKWCCIFHPTRDSIDAIHNVFTTEPVSVIGHNQWIWYPEEIARDKAYRFVHFYRHPVRKIVSGYRYHREGAEAWTSVPKPYADVCKSNLYYQALDASERNSSSSRGIRRSMSVGRVDVVDHCKSVQLCVTCCRREHEHVQLERAQLFARGIHRERHGSASKREYFLRPSKEYAFLCKHLGGITTIKETLRAQPLAEGLATESAIDFYESLRMARIVNHTLHDPNSLNIDLDDLTRDKIGFHANIWAVLNHLQLGLPDHELASLAREIDFYNIKNSFLYKWSMSVPAINNHVDTTRDSSDVAAVLSRSEEFKEMYASVLSLMHANPSAS